MSSESQEPGEVPLKNFLLILAAVVIIIVIAAVSQPFIESASGGFYLPSSGLVTDAVNFPEISQGLPGSAPEPMEGPCNFNGECEPVARGESWVNCIYDCPKSCTKDADCLDLDFQKPWCHPQSRICMDRGCSVVTMPGLGEITESLILASTASPPRLSYPSDEPKLPGSAPGTNLEDLYNSRCPLVERYVNTENGCDDSANGVATAADYKPKSDMPEKHLRTNGYRTLQGLLSIVKAPRFRNVRVEALFGSNHMCAQHREMRAFDISEVTYLDAGNKEQRVIINSAGGMHICEVAKIIYDYARPDRIAGPSRVPLACIKENPGLAGVWLPDGKHEDHLHVHWNAPCNLNAGETSG